MSSKWIWPFELLEKLGEGGMGVVYRARYVGNDRIVAIKLLPEEVAKNPTLVARFDRELEILTQLRHPNIVHCFGGTTESKQRFYAMELVEGGTLADQLRTKGRITWDHVVEYGIQICSALQYAHDKGIIHRDLKPSNFLLTKAGKLKLSDFGLATIIAGQRLTTAGKTAGTFLYMAPEQIRGKPPLSNRTDLYALGCVFYELLTGHPPFDSDSPAGVLHKHLKEAPPRVSSEVSGCPPDLDWLVHELLQKDPELRPASAADVEQRLENVLRPSLSTVDAYAHTKSTPVITTTGSASDDDLLEVPTSTETRRETRRWQAAVVVVGLLAGWGWWSAWTASSRSQRYLNIWIEAASMEGPHQIPALKELSKFPELPPNVIEMLVTTAESKAPADVRVAALETITEHQDECLEYVTRMHRLVRDEVDPVVRQQAEQTRQSLHAALDAPQSTSRFWIWLLTSLAVVGVAGWWLWQRVSQVRPSPVPPATVVNRAKTAR